MARIERIPVATHTRAPTGETCAYVVSDEESVLVDPGARDPELDDTADAAGIEHVAVTHTHPDHVGAVTQFAEAFDATVWGRRGYEGRFEAACGRRPDRTFVGGASVGPVTVLDTPGHAPDHVAFCVPSSDGTPTGSDSGPSLLVGDLAVATGSVVVGAPDGDLRAYLTSLRRLRTREASRWYPAHGPVIERPRRTAERLIAHRLDRERSVLAAVEAGARSIEEVLDRAYEKDLSGVEDLARATVRAHLEKLAVEGHVRIDADRVFAAGSSVGSL